MAAGYRSRQVQTAALAPSERATLGRVMAAPKTTQSDVQKAAAFAAYKLSPKERSAIKGATPAELRGIIAHVTAGRVQLPGGKGAASVAYARGELDRRGMSETPRAAASGDGRTAGS